MESIINHRLDFEDSNDDDDEDSSSSEAGSEPTSNSGLRKKLNFDFVDNCDIDGLEIEENKTNSSSAVKPKRSQDLDNSAASSLNLQLTPSLSPCRTRSGRIYIAASTEKLIEEKSKKATGGLPTPDFDLELNLLRRNMPRSDDMDTTAGPPPLNYVKRPVSRIRTNLSFQSPVVATASDPIQGPHSPPTHQVQAMKLFDPSPKTTSVSVPRWDSLKSRLLFGSNKDVSAEIPRRVSAPAPAWNIHDYAGDATTADLQRKRKRRSTNINPFTLTSMMASMRKKARMMSGESADGTIDGSFELAPKPINNEETVAIASQDDLEDEGPPKRLRVTDINITRYEEEFVEIKEIASGTFGKVKVARHRLDGMIYAIKVTRNQIYGNTHEERVAMNEVFAHSALIKHKHVVRYYNSWVENGRVYIQNEYCEGGSLASKIKEFRRSGNQKFSEAELKRILLHLSKGLQYIQSKLLVHLDLKPENIFISLDHPVPASPDQKKEVDPIEVAAAAVIVDAAAPKEAATASMTEESESSVVISGNESTDSGHHSGSTKNRRTDSNTSSPVDDRVAYKIGDLGHVAPIHGEAIPEEGDCRYMAPELLAMDVNRDLLTKADVFSLGLTLYEAASLKELPKNSLEDPEYEKIKAGDLPYLDGYSKDFNALLKAMVNPDPLARPSASRLANMQTLRGTNSSNAKSRSQLYQELKDTKAKVKMLEMQLKLSKTTICSEETKSTSTPKLSRLAVGRGTLRSRSSNMVTTTW